MIDLPAEPMTTTEVIAARYHVHPATVRRWCERGATARDGTHIRLAHLRTPGRIRISIAAVERFLAALGGNAEAETPTTRTPAKRARAAIDAREELRRMGV